MKIFKKLNYSLACILTATMLVASIPVHAALPVTGYNRTAANTNTQHYVEAYYNYSNFSVINKNNEAMLYQYVLKAEDSFTFSYDANAVGSGTTTVHTLDGQTVSEGLIVDDSSSPKRITAKTPGTYCVKFTNSDATAVSYLYVVVAPDSGGYTLTLPNIFPIFNQGHSYAYGYQLLLQPLAVGDNVSIKMYAPSTTYTANSAYFDVDSVHKDTSKSTDSNVAELSIDGTISSNTHTIQITTDYCDVGTIKAKQKGYAIARLRYGIDGSSYKIFNIEVPVGYKLPALKKAIVSSGAKSSGIKTNSINEGISLAYEHVYKNDLISVGMLEDGLQEKVKNESSYVTVGKDVGQEDNFIVYQYDEPVLVKDLTSIFGTNDGAQFPDAVRIDIAETDYDLPDNELYAGPKNFDVNVGTVTGSPKDMTAIYLPNSTELLKSSVEIADVNWSNLISGYNMEIIINEEPKKMVDYNLDKRILWVEGYFNSLPTVGSEYSIVVKRKNNSGNLESLKTMAKSEYGASTFGAYADRIGNVNEPPISNKIIPIKVNLTNVDCYKGYYLTIGAETRKIIFSMNDVFIVDEDFPTIPNNNTPCEITVDDPRKKLELPRNAVEVQYFSRGSEGSPAGLSAGGLSRMSGCYMTIGDERKQIITSGNNDIYVEKFDNLAAGQTYSFNMEGYAKDTANELEVGESVLREDVYNILQKGNSDLTWKTIYEDGFDGAMSNVEKGTDDRFAKFTVTWDMIQQYLSDKGDTDDLKPTSLIKITAIGVKEDSGARVYDPTKKINFIETYVNGANPDDPEPPTEPEDPPLTENNITTTIEDNTLKQIKIESFDKEQEDAKLIVVQYNQDGEIFKVDPFTVDVQSGKTIMVETEDIDLGSAVSYKIILWKDYGSIEPLFKMDELPINGN